MNAPNSKKNSKKLKIKKPLDHADMYNFLGPDIASEVPLENDRSEICIGHLRVIKHLKPHVCGCTVSNFVACRVCDVNSSTLNVIVFIIMITRAMSQI